MLLNLYIEVFNCLNILPFHYKTKQFSEIYPKCFSIIPKLLLISYLVWTYKKVLSYEKRPHLALQILLILSQQYLQTRNWGEILPPIKIEIKEAKPDLEIENLKAYNRYQLHNSADAQFIQ
jgi:hypothetical protein